MADPNPKVSGRGFAQLRAAGMEVEVGLLEAEARRLNEAFARYIRQGLPLVTLKSAMTLDGKIAVARAAMANKEVGIPAGGWITGEAARAHVHQQRHESDAILVGIGTILADDPLLTDRSGKPRRRRLLRVVLDSHLRLPLDSRLVRDIAKESAGGSDVLVFYSANNSSAEERARRELEARGVRTERAAAITGGRLDLPAILRRLGELEMISVMIEGGSAINGAALESGIVDKVFFYYAPTILGDASVPFAAKAHSIHNLSTRIAKNIRVHRFGEDVAIEGYLRDPYAE
jgi:diaminohydroxyphosphoribosylaminopyrimidine deaminase/5-amino-6-(5-phosphoribosylamino)uracil reductase